MSNPVILPIIAITSGDPAGIGPEIVLKALTQREIFALCHPLVLGDRRIYERAASWLNLPFDMNVCTNFSGVGFENDKAVFLDLHNADPEACPPGKLSVIAGSASVEYIFAACDMAMAGQAHAIVTAPLNKAAMNMGGYHFPGHTELLAERTGAGKVSMLLTSEKLRVVHVSTHVSLAEAINRVTPQRVGEVIQLAYESAKALGVTQPRIAVAGLNPHAGEGGLFGDHEQQIIMPAIIAARARGLNVSDPQPGDTVFLRAVKGEFDIVVAMYHDQGHIPMKLLAFDSGVNVSMGLPIIRTSVDHGTAFDIAGKGIARENSMVQAIRVAVQMVQAKWHNNS
jgi:4-hydroxythreonine-4-phosphate dehydrogenase